MTLNAARVTALLCAVMLVLGVLGSAALTLFPTDPPPPLWLRIAAVAFVVVGGFIPVWRQTREELTTAKWERHVSYGRRDLAPAKNSSIFGISPGDTLFKVRQVMGGGEDDIWSNFREAPDGSDHRRWNRPGFVLSVLCSREQVLEVKVQLKPGSPRKSPRIAAPSAVLGKTKLADLRRVGRKPDRSGLWSAENNVWLWSTWQTGPEGSLDLTLEVAEEYSDDLDYANTPFSICTLSYHEVRARQADQLAWPGWPETPIKWPKEF